MTKYNSTDTCTVDTDEYNGHLLVQDMCSLKLAFCIRVLAFSISPHLCRTNKAFIGHLFTQETVYLLHTAIDSSLPLTFDIELMGHLQDSHLFLMIHSQSLELLLVSLLCLHQLWPDMNHHYTLAVGTLKTTINQEC